LLPCPQFRSGSPVGRRRTAPPPGWFRAGAWQNHHQSTAYKGVEIQSGTLDTLSNASTGLLFAAMKRSRTSRGRARKGAVLGSSSDRMIVVKWTWHPCSPHTMRTG
jgi:hypothetical protein